ncbi:hypothetical protein B5M44_14430 [Shinella sumterensis]|uniref:hypothetical protein n=1 Tax=Shinella sumterensis TaxID=1967501 RepID=UPI00106E8B7E|nr:hypothetical protein [Shinella sumterensis]MCD1263497.1 hypothetical protein [Shinella sumterensis]TFE97492.1 hypothetical protein B5M44_14430 [Shinella sumterensis]
MSPEWMIAFDRQEAMSHETRHKSLADPLERMDWRGLQWVNTLFSRIAAARRRQRLKSRQSPVSRWIFAPEVSRGR